MSTRHRYLVAYDVADEKRLRRMYRTMRGFGDPVQLSVFTCELSPREFVIFETQVSSVMNMAEDRLLVADLGPVEGRAEETIHRYGVMEPPRTRRAVVV